MDNRKDKKQNNSGTSHFKGKLPKRFQQVFDDMASFTSSFDKQRKKLEKKPINNLLVQLKAKVRDFSKRAKRSPDPSSYKDTLIFLIQFFDFSTGINDLSTRMARINDEFNPPNQLKMGWLKTNDDF